jgi:hypothetical protein
MTSARRWARRVGLVWLAALLLEGTWQTVGRGYEVKWLWYDLTTPLNVHGGLGVYGISLLITGAVCTLWYVAETLPRLRRPNGSEST